MKDPIGVFGRFLEGVGAGMALVGLVFFVLDRLLPELGFGLAGAGVLSLGAVLDLRSENRRLVEQNGRLAERIRRAESGLDLAARTWGVWLPVPDMLVLNAGRLKHLPLLLLYTALHECRHSLVGKYEDDPWTPVPGPSETDAMVWAGRELRALLSEEKFARFLELMALDSHHGPAFLRAWREAGN